MYIGRVSDKILVAARVSRETADILDAAAFVRRSSMQTLVAPFLADAASQLAKEADVATAMAARDAHDQRAKGTVSDIRGRKK